MWITVALGCTHWYRLARRPRRETVMPSGMSAEPPQSPALPLEVLYKIVESVETPGAVESTLRNCTLTCHALLSCSQNALYRNIRMQLDTPQGFWKAELLSRTLLADPTLGSLIQTLVIYRIVLSPSLHLLLDDDHPNTIISEIPPLPSTVLPFGHMSQLRTLLFSCLCFQRADDFLDIIVSLPRLKRLACTTIEVLERTARPRVRHETRFPTLSELSVRRWAGPHNTFAQLLLPSHDPSESADGAAEMLHLDLGTRVGGIGGGIEWSLMIRTASARLRSLKIATADVHLVPDTVHARMLLQPYGGTLHSYILENISCCSYLRILTLGYTPMARANKGEDVYGGGFLDALCSVLERRPAPFPALEHLDLRMRDIDGEMVSVKSDVCERLASCLLDKTARPRFACLAVLVHLVRWVEIDGMLYAGPELDLRGIDCGSVVERWRAAFSDFQRASGVVLTVCLYDYRESEAMDGYGTWPSSFLGRF
ncbi:hypothetical protein BV20DRAFT_1116856 [Pilatotrama ljubarskyi]|nr:hypothetical protein BV20DRAFT_1116856 [Pilatotrama ljubarskyi]